MSTEFNFPANPTVGDIFVLPNGSETQWNGTEWALVVSEVVYPITVDKGGTDAITAADARINLGLNTTTGEFIVPDGTVTNPGLAFDLEPSLGWYRDGSTQIRMTAQGSNTVLFDFATDTSTVFQLWPRVTGTSIFAIQNQPVGVIDFNQFSIRQETNGNVTMLSGGGGTFTKGSLNFDVGLLTSNSNFIIDKINPGIIVNKGTSDSESAYVQGLRGGLSRWGIYLGGPQVEVGGNTGSDFSIARFSDTGDYLYDSLHINRGDSVFLIKSPQVSINRDDVNGPCILTLGAPNGGSTITMQKALAEHYNSINGSSGGVNRWQLNLGNSSGNFEVSRFDGSGAFQGAPLTILGADGGIVISTDVSNSGVVYSSYNAGGDAFYATANGGFRTDKAVQTAFYAPQGGIQVGTDGTYRLTTGSWTGISDERLKEAIEDYTIGLDAILVLRPRTFAFKKATGRSLGGERYTSLVAQEAMQVMPDLVTSGPGELGEIKFDDLHHLNITNVTYALINAVKTLHSRVKELESK
jgi:hypothetical protein